MRVGMILLWGCLVVFATSRALAQGETLDAEIQAATKALEVDPSDTRSLARRASLYAAAGEPAKAVADYDRLIKFDKTSAAAYDARGSEQFKLGHVDESIADFDRALKLQPDQEPWHWKRGISYYYAGRWDAGRRQFEGYQTVDDNDVENAVWRFLCMARDQGVDAARGDLLKIKRDLRVPMMEVYGLYQGELKPADVLAAIEAGNPTPAELNARRFYAHLYLGLYYEVAGDADLAKKHIELARGHKIGHYMWNVADVHAQRLSAAEESNR
jgi:lipoprotein NlpI